MRCPNIVLAGVAALSGCGPPAAVTVADSWIRLPAAPGRPGAGYFTIRGGATDRTLVAITTPAAARVELHETVRRSGGMTMRAMPRVLVPAGATIRFAPGGKHLMLFDIAPGVTAARSFPMTFRFADGHALTIESRTVSAGDPPPGG